MRFTSAIASFLAASVVMASPIVTEPATTSKRTLSRRSVWLCQTGAVPCYLEQQMQDSLTGISSMLTYMATQDFSTGVGGLNAAVSHFQDSANTLQRIADGITNDISTTPPSVRVQLWHDTFEVINATFPELSENLDLLVSIENPIFYNTLYGEFYIATTTIYLASNATIFALQTALGPVSTALATSVVAVRTIADLIKQYR